MATTYIPMRCGGPMRNANAAACPAGTRRPWPSPAANRHRAASAAEALAGIRHPAGGQWRSPGAGAAEEPPPPVAVLPPAPPLPALPAPAAPAAIAPIAVTEAPLASRWRSHRCAPRRRRRQRRHDRSCLHPFSAAASTILRASPRSPNCRRAAQRPPALAFRRLDLFGHAGQPAADRQRPADARGRIARPRRHCLSRSSQGRGVEHPRPALRSACENCKGRRVLRPAGLQWAGALPARA